MQRTSNVGSSFATQRSTRRGLPTGSERIRVILVDDHAMVREGISLLLRNASDMAVVGEADDGVAAVALAHRVVPDVILLDLDMPHADGEAALRELGRTLPESRVLVLTVHAESERLVALLEAGACGYLNKEAASSELVEAIRAVAAGDIYVRPTAARLLAAAVVPHGAAESPHGRYLALSPRERSTVRLVAEGFSGVEIARKLGISTKTVDVLAVGGIDVYKHRIRQKLGLEHRTDYVRFGVESGILSCSSSGSI